MSASLAMMTHSKVSLISASATISVCECVCESLCVFHRRELFVGSFASVWRNETNEFTHVTEMRGVRELRLLGGSVMLTAVIIIIADNDKCRRFCMTQ